MRKGVAFSNVLIYMTLFIGVMLMSCNQEKKHYYFTTQGNVLYINIPHPSTINLLEKDYWNYVDLEGIKKETFAILLKNSHLGGHCELKVRYKMNPITDKYGNATERYQDAYITRIPLQEVPKYKGSDYFAVAYSLNRHMRRTAFGIDNDFELIAEPPKQKHSILYYIWHE